MAPTPRILVVGAGAAGLAAARRLARAGADVAVLERATRPGGRLRGRTREGFTREPSAPVLSTSDGALRGLLAEEGMGDELQVLRSAGDALLDGRFLHELPGTRPLDLLRRRGIDLRQALRTLRLERLLRRYGPNLDPARPERAAPHDDRSLSDFARLYFGAGVLEAWMGPETTSDCLGDEDETSRVLFLLRHAARRGARPALFRRGAGGFVAALADGVDVRGGVEVGSVECEGRRGALVRFRRDEAEGTAGADAVIVAVPAPEAARLAGEAMAPAERDFHAGVTYEPAISAEVLLDDPGVPRYVRARVPRRERLPVASIAIEPGRQGGRVPDGHAVARVVARSDWSREHLAAPDDAIAKSLCAVLERVHPIARDRTLEVSVARWERALPSFEVGRYRALARFRRVEADRAACGRRIWFAGDHLVAPSVEGAVASGLRAAESALAAIAPGPSEENRLG